MNIRERLEENEKKLLSPFATLAANTKGRKFPSEKCEIRTEYQRDRDKIIHSKAFRRLKHKTQVFIAPDGDHFRTRLTHTLEVAQIARTIARSLMLNEDLTEAMALGHDLGHTPFGHSGERMLNDLCAGGFKHNEQSVRVCELLEDGKGLNLTFEVLDGIAHHTGSEMPETLEGQILRYADRIAYINHDIDDALRAKIIKTTDLPKDCIDVLGDTHAKRIDTMIKDIIRTSTEKPEIKMSENVQKAMDNLRKYMFDNVYIVGDQRSTEEWKAKRIIKSLFEYFTEYPEEVPFYKELKDKGFTVEEMVTDYIAGMTDQYAIYVYTKIFIPKSIDKM
ncbi:MAG: deoxyguanosinetriphosphate triphosphohydrolase [Clostridia bacterium]|nr:deoxyguanosinetriphosphate triphosphohydrolase [Clostridia bacterium]